MQFDPPLIPATLVRRYKRFLSDITLESGEEITAHVANPGAMTGLAEPGSTVWLSRSDDPKRKLKWSWQLATAPNGALVCVNTGLTNRLVEEGLRANAIPGLDGAIRREVKTGDSRLDFLLGENTYVEVKAVTLSRRPGWAEFPDAKTARGAKHLNELKRLRQEGHRAAMLYVAMRDDCTRFGIAADIDLAYAEALKDACDAGVEIITACVEATPQGLTLIADRKLDWTRTE